MKPADSVAPIRQRWYARFVTTIPVLGDGTSGPVFRVLSVVTAPGPVSAEHDYLAILPAAASAARAGRPFVAGWLCRAPGSPLEFLTNA